MEVNNVNLFNQALMKLAEGFNTPMPKDGVTNKIFKPNTPKNPISQPNLMPRSAEEAYKPTTPMNKMAQAPIPPIAGYKTGPKYRPDHNADISAMEDKRKWSQHYEQKATTVAPQFKQNMLSKAQTFKQQFASDSTKLTNRGFIEPKNNTISQKPQKSQQPTKTEDSNWTRYSGRGGTVTAIADAVKGKFKL